MFRTLISINVMTSLHKNNQNLRVRIASQLFFFTKIHLPFLVYTIIMLNNQNAETIQLSNFV